MKFAASALGVLFFVSALACAQSRDTEYAAPVRPYKIIAEHPHDVRDSTQGLLLIEDRLIESTGLYGRSALIEKNWRTGKTLRRTALADKYFGEGIARLGDHIFQLTWQHGIGFIYNLALQPQQQFRYAGEGWGLTSDGSQLILSDGSARLRFFDPKNFAETASVVVRDQGRAVDSLNELEYARKRILANVWHSDRVAVIEPRGGAVEAWLDFSALRERFKKPAGWDASEHVLNGIAYDPRSGHFLVTGKCWPTLFEIAIPVDQ